MKKFRLKIRFSFLWKLWKFYKKYILKHRVQERKYGRLKDSPDDRDYVYKCRRIPAELPPSTNRKNIEAFLHRYDQGKLGSCCAFGSVEAFRRVLEVNKMPDFDPSPLFAYYNLRVDKNRDCGGEIRNAFRAMNIYGICSEKSWPYNINKFRELPPAEAFTEAMEHQSVRYDRIYPATKEAIMDAISQGFPVVYGKDLFSSFESDWVKFTGIVPYPKSCEPFVGGHCMVIFDYDELGTVELNSWGKDWGIDGTCHFPWEYVLTEKWCNDFWVLYLTE